MTLGEERISKKDILLVGVGGQGTVLAGKILAQVGVKAGLAAKVSEIHGMAQRGGGVVTQVRLGSSVSSPVVSRGQVDAIIAFEKLEAARWIPYLSSQGWMIVNDQEVMPLPVLAGEAVYPAGIIGQLCCQLHQLRVVQAVKLATECGSPRSMNLVLLGILAPSLGFPRTLWEEVIAEAVPPSTREVNLKAFGRGWALESTA